ncbi:MAG: ribosomal-processing cysteine protease Prp [Lachnospiraceae bacterium]|nr:ribosomal-processing cysteine protease Prp [Lachnospiraceae bacterium]
MTDVQVTRKDGAYRSVYVRGHAGFAEEGEDIVCAAISALTINTVNCLEEIVREEMTTESSEDGAVIGIRFPKVPGKEATLLIDCLLYGLRSIREQYGKSYLNLEIKEV